MSGVQRLKARLLARLQNALRPVVRDAVEEVVALRLDDAVHAAFGASVDVQWRRYLALGLLASAPKHTDLAAAECRVFSQNGEDGVLHALLARVQTNPYFVEFGAGNGSQGNCVLLADVVSWEGLFIEADPALFRNLAAKYDAIPKVQTVNAEVTPDNIDGLLREAEVPSEPGVLSIDVDGADFFIWKALSAIRPAIVVVEYNGALSPRSREVFPYVPGQKWDGSSSFGASLGALVDLATEKGYALVHTDLTGVNAFFVRDDLVADLKTGDAVAWRAANYLFQGRGFPDSQRLPVTFD